MIVPGRKAEIAVIRNWIQTFPHCTPLPLKILGTPLRYNNYLPGIVDGCPTLRWWPEQQQLQKPWSPRTRKTRPAETAGTSPTVSILNIRSHSNNCGTVLLVITCRTPSLIFRILNEKTCRNLKDLGCGNDAILKNSTTFNAVLFSLNR